MEKFTIQLPSSWNVAYCCVAAAVLPQHSSKTSQQMHITLLLSPSSNMVQSPIVAASCKSRMNSFRMVGSQQMINHAPKRKGKPRYIYIYGSSQISWTSKAEVPQDPTSASAGPDHRSVLSSILCLAVYPQHHPRSIHMI